MLPSFSNRLSSSFTLSPKAYVIIFYLPNVTLKNSFFVFFYVMSQTFRINSSLISFHLFFSCVSIFLIINSETYVLAFINLNQPRARDVTPDNKFIFLVSATKKVLSTNFVLVSITVSTSPSIFKEGSSFPYVHTFVLVLFNFKGFCNLLLISLKDTIFETFTEAPVSTNAQTF